MKPRVGYMSCSILAVLLCVALLAGCAGGEDPAGKYVAAGNGTEVVLTLSENGRGTWSTEDDDVEFTWERRGSQVWLHTRSGGVVSGTLGPAGSIDMDLPAVGSFTFKRME